MDESPRGVVVATFELERFASEVFEHAGMAPASARRVAQALVWADSRGISTHGVSRIPMYLRWITVGDIDPGAEMTTYRDSPAVVVLDANRGAGPVAMAHAMSVASRKARELGVGVALVRRTTHTAALGYYTQQAAREGVAALAFAASSPLMAYHGARVAGVGTCPLSIAVPGGVDGPVVFDMSTGVVSLGALLQAAKQGARIPEGWALDAAGNPTTDGGAAKIPLPMAGAKGSGLALMVEMLVSLLASNPLLADAFEDKPEGRHHRQNAMTIAIDIGRFVDLQMFTGQVLRLARLIKALPVRDAEVEIRLPGERGDLVQKRSNIHGISVPSVIWRELENVARAREISMPRPLANPGGTPVRA